MSQSNVEAVIELNNIATDFVVGTAGKPHRYATELVLRNIAVLSDRLQPHQMGELTTASSDAMFVAAGAASEAAPSKTKTIGRLPHETEADYYHRAGLCYPLHKLQSAVQQDALDMSKPKTEKALKRAVWLGSSAFEAVLCDPAVAEFSNVLSTIRYFTGNARMAVDIGLQSGALASLRSKD